jgi:hypothetical protein
MNYDILKSSVDKVMKANLYSTVSLDKIFAGLDTVSAEGFRKHQHKSKK